MLSVVYGKILVIFGLVFPMAQVIAKEVPSDHFQFFYIYLFSGCLFFHVYVQLDTIVTRWRLKWRTRQRGSDNINDLDCLKVPRPVHCYGSFYLRIGQVRK